MALGYDGRLYILAFDHRGSFRRMFGIQGREPTADELETLKDGKKLIWEGFQTALDEGAPRDSAGILVDEEMGADVAREAAKMGVNFAMPVEASGEPVFQFEYGDDFGTHIEDFDPAFSKVLVRYNPDDPDDEKQTQIDRLKRLSDWLHERDRNFLFELLVPASDAQLDQVDGDSDRYDKEVRPDLMIECIRDLQDGGVEPDIWKIEGIDRQEDCERIAQTIRRADGRGSRAEGRGSRADGRGSRADGRGNDDGRDNVVAVVLGRGADAAPVDHWLEQGAPVDGYVGFAIGRTIWRDPLQAFVDGDKGRDEAAQEIANNYRRFIDVYDAAT